MTLVVARKIDDTLVIVSDSKVTDDAMLHPSLLNGALKTIVVSSTLCVSFAGNVPLATEALAEVITGSIRDRDDLIVHLLKCHRQCSGACDFLIACHKPPILLARVTEGRCETDLQTTWIGDHTAFEAYQEKLATDPFAQSTARYAGSDEMAVASRMQGALSAVIADGLHPSVGNFVITARSGTLANSGFRYDRRAFGSGFHPVASTTEPTSLMRSVGVEGGSFHYSVLTPTARGIGAIAVHIVEPRLGVLLHPKGSWEPRIWRDVNTVDLINNVAEQFGLAVDGFRYG